LLRYRECGYIPHRNEGKTDDQDCDSDCCGDGHGNRHDRGTGLAAVTRAPSKGNWLVVHEHVSIPVDLDTGKPDLASKP
jgi:hypothetical protein